MLQWIYADLDTIIDCYSENAEDTRDAERPEESDT